MISCGSCSKSFHTFCVGEKRIPYGLSPKEQRDRHTSYVSEVFGSSWQCPKCQTQAAQASPMRSDSSAPPPQRAFDNSGSGHSLATPSPRSRAASVESLVDISPSKADTGAVSSLPSVKLDIPDPTPMENDEQADESEGGVAGGNAGEEGAEKEKEVVGRPDASVAEAGETEETDGGKKESLRQSSSAALAMDELQDEEALSVTEVEEIIDVEKEEGVEEEEPRRTPPSAEGLETGAKLVAKLEKGPVVLADEQDKGGEISDSDDVLESASDEDEGQLQDGTEGVDDNGVDMPFLEKEAQPHVVAPEAVEGEGEERQVVLEEMTVAASSPEPEVPAFDQSETSANKVAETSIARENVIKTTDSSLASPGASCPISAGNGLAGTAVAEMRDFRPAVGVMLVETPKPEVGSSIMKESIMTLGNDHVSDSAIATSSLEVAELDGVVQADEILGETTPEKNVEYAAVSDVLLEPSVSDEAELVAADTGLGDTVKERRKTNAAGAIAAVEGDVHQATLENESERSVVVSGLPEVPEPHGSAGATKELEETIQKGTTAMAEESRDTTSDGEQGDESAAVPKETFQLIDPFSKAKDVGEMEQRAEDREPEPTIRLPEPVEPDSAMAADDYKVGEANAEMEEVEERTAPLVGLAETPQPDNPLSADVASEDLSLNGSGQRSEKAESASAAPSLEPAEPDSSTPASGGAVDEPLAAIEESKEPKLDGSVSVDVPPQDVALDESGQQCGEEKSAPIALLLERAEPEGPVAPANEAADEPSVNSGESEEPYTPKPHHFVSADIAWKGLALDDSGQRSEGGEGLAPAAHSLKPAELNVPTAAADYAVDEPPAEIQESEEPKLENSAQFDATSKDSRRLDETEQSAENEQSTLLAPCLESAGSEDPIGAVDGAVDEPIESKETSTSPIESPDTTELDGSVSADAASEKTSPLHEAVESVVSAPSFLDISDLDADRPVGGTNGSGSVSGVEDVGLRACVAAKIERLIQQVSDPGELEFARTDSSLGASASDGPAASLSAASAPMPKATSAKEPDAVASDALERETHRESEVEVRPDCPVAAEETLQERAQMIKDGESTAMTTALQTLSKLELPFTTGDGLEVVPKDQNEEEEVELGQLSEAEVSKSEPSGAAPDDEDKEEVPPATTAAAGTPSGIPTTPAKQLGSDPMVDPYLTVSPSTPPVSLSPVRRVKRESEASGSKSPARRTPTTVGRPPLAVITQEDKSPFPERGILFRDFPRTPPAGGGSRHGPQHSSSLPRSPPQTPGTSPQGSLSPKTPRRLPLGPSGNREVLETSRGPMWSPTASHNRRKSVAAIGHKTDMVSSGKAASIKGSSASTAAAATVATAVTASTMTPRSRDREGRAATRDSTRARRLQRSSSSSVATATRGSDVDAAMATAASAAAASDSDNSDFRRGSVEHSSGSGVHVSKRPILRRVESLNNLNDESQGFGLSETRERSSTITHDGRDTLGDDLAAVVTHLQKVPMRVLCMLDNLFFNYLTS